jgi:hypothetical protein
MVALTRHVARNSWSERKDLLQFPATDLALTRQETVIWTETCRHSREWTPGWRPRPDGSALRLTGRIGN